MKNTNKKKYHKLESEFQDEVRIELSKLGYITFRTNVGKVKMNDGRYFKTGLPKGFSDIIALKHGETIFIELKTGNNKPTPAQIKFIEQMRLNGFKAGVAWNMEDILDILEGKNV